MQTHRHRLLRATLVLATSAPLFLCCEDETPPGPEIPAVETRSIRDVDYVKDRFFFIDDPAFFIGANESTLDVFLTVTAQDLAKDPSIVRAPAWVTPDPYGDGQWITDGAERLKIGARPFSGLYQDFRLLQPGVDYDLIHSSTGDLIGVALRAAVPPTAQKTLAMRYVNLNAAPIGGSYSSYGINATPDTLILEMIKAPDPRPDGPFEYTWLLMMRNVYYLGWHNIDFEALSVRIEDVITARAHPSRPVGSDVPYLRIFGLDLTDSLETGPPDGQIDGFSYQLDLSKGFLFFPDPRAFAPDTVLVNTWTDGEFNFTGPYEAQYEKAGWIYNANLNPSEREEFHQYLIKAFLIVPAE